MQRRLRIANPWQGAAGRRGASGAEFAAVLPVMAIVLLGLIAALRGYYTKIVTVAATNDCAVMASQAGAIPGFMAVQHDQQIYGIPFQAPSLDQGVGGSRNGACLVTTRYAGFFPGLDNLTSAYLSYPRQRYHSDWSGKAAPAPLPWP